MILRLILQLVKASTENWEVVFAQPVKASTGVSGIRGVHLNYQLVMNLLLRKVSNCHIMKTEPPKNKLLHRFVPIKNPAKVSSHGHILPIM